MPLRFSVCLYSGKPDLLSVFLVDPSVKILFRFLHKLFSEILIEALGDPHKVKRNLLLNRPLSLLEAVALVRVGRLHLCVRLLGGVGRLEC